MIRKLKLKFIAASMAIVVLMLSAIFGLLYYSTAKDLERESLQMLQNVAESAAKPGPPGKHPGGVHLPYFILIADQSGEIVMAQSSYPNTFAEEELSDLYEKTADPENRIGTLPSCHLRYLRLQSPMGTEVIFADTSYEQSTLAGLVRAFLAIGGLSCLIFLALSVLFARWAVRPVESALKQQKQFVADASHELKTPLTVITTDAELLRQEDCSLDDRAALTDAILTMTSQMRGLVENLLDLARIDNGTVKEEFRQIQADELITEAAMLFEPVFFEKDLPFSYEIEDGITMNAIPSHLKQAVTILLDNASKYAAPGGETILRFKRTGHNRCTIEVANVGEQIAKEDLSQLFKRFYRADKSRAMNHSYGLGLSIAQSIAEEHRGRISCTSENSWNTFVIELPL